MITKKFLINTNRNLVVLISGSFLIDKPRPEPRELLINGMDETITKKDTMLAVSKKLLQLVSKTYEKTDKVDLNLQVCGFDGRIPRIYVVSFKIGTTGKIEEVGFCLTGAPAILDYGRTRDGKSRIAILRQMVPNAQIVQENVRKLVANAIDYENKTAIANGEKPRTGGGINIVTVFQEALIWTDPKADSKDDQYQVGVR